MTAVRKMIVRGGQVAHRQPTTQLFLRSTRTRNTIATMREAFLRLHRQRKRSSANVPPSYVSEQSILFFAIPRNTARDRQATGCGCASAVRQFVWSDTRVTRVKSIDLKSIVQSAGRSGWTRIGSPACTTCVTRASSSSIQDICTIPVFPPWSTHAMQATLILWFCGSRSCEPYGKTVTMSPRTSRCRRHNFIRGHEKCSRECIYTTSNSTSPFSGTPSSQGSTKYGTMRPPQDGRLFQSILNGLVTYPAS